MKLNDVCEVYSGYALKSFNDTEDGLPVIKIGNILADGSLRLDACQYTTDNVNEKYYSNKGDIYIALSGATTGKIGIMDSNERHIINQRVGIVRKKFEDIPQEYIKYFLLRQTDRILQEAAGCAQPNISPKQIAEYIVPKLSEEDMLGICNILDKTKSVIDKRKVELEYLDNLIKSRFVEMFGDPEINPMGWEQVILSDVCSSIVRGPFGSALKKEFFVGPDVDTYKVYEQKHAIQKSATIGNYYVNKEKYEELRRFECVPGDILMSCSGTMGEMYQLPEGCEKGIINQALCKFTLNDRILPICFLVYMEQTIGNLETKGSGIKNIAAVSYVKQMPINLPPMEVQIKFADFVKQVTKLKFEVQKSLDETQVLLDSLMQQYFG